MAVMAKTIELKTAEGITRFTYTGAEPGDDSPGGAVLRFMIATAKRDLDEARANMLPMPEGNFTPSPPPGDIEVVLEPATIEDDKATVPSESKAGAEEVKLPFLVVRQNGKWLVDMGTTLEKMMSQAMQMMADTMGQAMSAIGDGIGNAMKEAFGGESGGALESGQNTDEDEPPAEKRGRRDR